MIRRVLYSFTGTVQGVGFRPFIYRIASKLKLHGFVQNSPGGVRAEVEGPDEAVHRFLDDVRQTLPPLAEITGISSEEIPVREEPGFFIRESLQEGDRHIPIPPDSATCDDCLQELFNPDDRRFRYPFTNCTNCGPRLTIVSGIPYDRENTSMACFSLCPECRQEYETPFDRRFHAEPNACSLCGPTLQLLDADGRELQVDDPLQEAVERLLSGAVIAVKGLGGFHLAVDAKNDQAVRELRQRKFREEKPLAVMVRDMETALQLCEATKREQALLESPERPIVLVRKKKFTTLAPSVAPGMPDLGIMLPGTPLHHLLLENISSALVMTSANRTDEPICTGNREAVKRLYGIADFYLVHNRDILVRCDDSITMVAAGDIRLMRRARGFVPNAVPLQEPLPGVLALGPHLKATVCIVKGDRAYLSPHIGDMETPQARDFFHESVDLMQNITQSTPGVIACDLHPGYYSTRAAADMQAETVIPVQHHHAHIVGCLAENAATGPVIGIAMDGTGYGEDGHIWGGEFLIADTCSYTRAAHIKYFPLPGSEQAIREPWRIAAALLQSAFPDDWKEKAHSLDLPDREGALDTIETMLRKNLNCPRTSSLGRLFDGVAALLGIRRKVSFEGQAAMELEAASVQTNGSVLPFLINTDEIPFQLDFSPLIRDIVEKRRAGGSTAQLAASFHLTLCHAFADTAELLRQKHSLSRVALSGGCFQNRLLLERCKEELGKRSFKVYTHRLIPTNDGGIALGQAVCAGTRIKNNPTERQTTP